MSKSRAKLNEAKYFYEQMESKFKERKSEEFKHCINAFLSSARSVTFVRNGVRLHKFTKCKTKIECEVVKPDPKSSQRFINILKGYKENSQVDIGCVLEKGSFIVDYHNCFSVNKSSKEEALIYFFLNLLIQLQNLGSVPAIDIYLYAKVLDSFK